MPLYSDAREFFEAVAEANRDAERVKRQLDALEQRALGMGGGGFEPRVRSTPVHDRMGNAVAALVDRETKRHARIEEDYRLIDKAVAVLYGNDLQDGLASLAPPWWADVLDLRYIEGMTWAEVGAAVCYSPSHCRLTANAALDLLDAHGELFAALGIGLAT